MRGNILHSFVYYSVTYVLVVEMVVISPVLLFDVSEDLHMLRSNLPAISQQVSSTGVQQALISHVRKDETLSPDKIQTCPHTATLQCCQPLSQILVGPMITGGYGIMHSITVNEPEARATARACWLAEESICTPSGRVGQMPLTAVHTAVIHAHTSGPREKE